MKSFFSVIKEFNYKKDVDLTSYNTFRIKARAKILIEVNSQNLVRLINLLKIYNKKYIILGCGSNVIFASKVVKQIVVVVKDKASICVRGSETISCGAGESLPNVVLHYLKNGYSGFEWAVGIPASVGGAVVMNAGAFSSSMKDVIKSVTYFDGSKVKRINASQCGFEYRSSIFKKEGWIVLRVEFYFKEGVKEDILDKMKNYLDLRKSKQPSEPSAGSIFKNGENFYAGKLIEELGLKGKKVGGAGVSNVHANFIINSGGASGRDVVKLIKYIKKLAKIKFNATLYEEVVIQ